MSNHESVGSNQEKLPNVNDSKYKKMTEKLLSDETEIQNIPYSSLGHLIDYLKAYQATLIKQNHYKEANQIGNLREKVISEFNIQTNQLNQYNQKETDTARSKSKFDDDTKILERQLLQKQIQEQNDFEKKWKDDNKQDTPEYDEAKSQLEEKFRKEIEDFHLSRQQQKQQMMEFYKNPHKSNTSRSKSASSRKKSRSATSYAKSRRPLTSSGRPQTGQSVNSTKSRSKQQNATKPDYSIFFPLYKWIGKKKSNDSNDDADKNNDYSNNEISDKNGSNSNNSQENQNSSKNKNGQNIDDQEGTENGNTVLQLGEADEYSSEENKNKRKSDKNQGKLDQMMNNNASALLGDSNQDGKDKNNDFSATSASIVSNDDLNSTMGPKLLMLAEGSSDGENPSSEISEK